MVTRAFFVLLGCLACSPANAVQPSPEEIVGAWVCGPYQIHGAAYAVTAVDRPVYSQNGEFISDGSGLINLPTGEEVKVEIRHTGLWELNGDVLRVTYSSAQFLSSSSELFPVEAGQASLDSQMARKNWSEKQVLESRDRLVTVVLKAEPKEAAVTVSCAKA